MIRRSYNAPGDYKILLAAAKGAGGMSLGAIARGLEAVGIEWPADFNDNRSEVAHDLDRDIRRAWKECGYHA